MMPKNKLAVIFLMSHVTIGISVNDEVLCGQYQNLTSPSQEFTFSTNAWGQDDSGASCINITNNATSFTSTWSWGANESLVHAFPNVNLNAVRNVPIVISNMSAINVDVAWSMVPSSVESSSAFDMNGLQDVDTRADVAFDMFLDPDPHNSTSTTAPLYEVMVWIGKIGEVLPIGFENATATLPSCKMGNTLFTLYNGANDNGQHVFSWVADQNMTSFNGDLSQSIEYLWRHGLILANNYLGILQFGTETLHAKSNVTFTASKVDMDIVMGTPKVYSGAPKQKQSLILLTCAVLMMLLVEVQ